MKKIFRKSDKFNRATYSEQYIVRYTYLKDDGFWESAEEMYFAAGKSAHKAVEALFKKDMGQTNKKYRLQSVIYC